MKNFFLFVFLISFSQSYSQVADGQAVYELKVNLHKRLKPEDEKLKEMMPEFKTQKMQLLFNKYESYYKEFEDEDDDIQPNPGSGRMRFMSPKNELYRNYKTKRKVDLKEFFGEKFRIEDTITPKGWKITNETKKINNYPCMHATLNDTINKKVVSAWFTSQIPTMSGPEGYGFLPGLIVEMTINEDEMYYTLIDYKNTLTKKDVIQVPTSGKLITEIEFKKLVESKTKEMRGRRGMMRTN